MHDIVIPDLDEAGDGEGSGGGSGGASESVGASDFVRVKFTKFVELVANHNFEEVMKEHGDDEVLVGPNLLTDLANAHESSEGDTKKLPVILLVGIILGIVVTYLVMQF